MNPKTKNLLLVALGTSFALLAYWQTGEPVAQPEVVPFLLVEALAFGMGVAFALGAGPMLRAAVDDARSARLAHLGASWILLTWALYDALELHFGHALLDLLTGHHAYHVTLVAAGLGVAQYVARLVRARAVGGGPETARGRVAREA